MEKLIYLLGTPEGRNLAELEAQLREHSIEALQSAGARNIRACIDDDHVAAATQNRQGDLNGQAWCYLSLWVTSRSLHPAMKAVLQDISSFQHGYAVAESEQLFHEFERDGTRVEGMNEVVLFRKPEAMERRDWLTTWLESHTKIAIDTQSTFGYIQHIVGDTLDEETPWYDAIVEENFPEAAISSPEAFYDAEGDPELMQKNQGIMIESVMRFIDLESIQVIPMSEYNF